MRKYNINASIIRAIENLYDRAQSAVLDNGSRGEWFRTTVGVRQGCLLSPTLFNIFLERIMCEALDDHEGSVSIGGRLITNFRFADDIVVNVEEEEEAGDLIDHLDRTTTRYRGARWLSGRVSDSGARGPGFETYRRRVVSLSKTLYSPKVLVNYPGSDGSVPTWLKNCWLGR